MNSQLIVLLFLETGNAAENLKAGSFNFELVYIILIEFLS
jgi:hypothetical protein